MWARLREKETITIWGAYDILEKELNYANASPEDATFHVDRAIRFVKRSVEEELKLDITDYLPFENLERLLE